MNNTLKVNLDSIARRLFEAPGVLARLCGDYGFEPQPRSPGELARALWQAFGQTPVDDPQAQRRSNGEVFRAAVRAIGSNSRKWSTYLLNEPRLQGLLFGFDPVAVHGAVNAGRLDVDAIKGCLPGQSSTGDAKAILQWAERLATGGDFHKELRVVAERFKALAEQELPGGFREGELFLCVVGFLGYPPERWLKRAQLPDPWKARTAAQWKLPGMGYALTSEMLRNLRWDGFKVDRHIMRLLGNWVPDLVQASRPRAIELAKLVGTKNRDLLDVLEYSLAGMQLSPQGIPRGHVDNMIWALGAYVEKRGLESDRNYLVSRP